MSEYKRKFRLAVADFGRRSGLKIAAGLGVAVALGFLLAALWGALARELALGPTLASLIIGLGLLVIAGLLLLLGRHARHQMPSAAELGDEVRAKASLAALTALAEARAGLASARDGASDKVRSMFGGGRKPAARASASASAAPDAAATGAQGPDSTASDPAAEDAPAGGFDFSAMSESLNQAGHSIADALQHFRQSRAAPAVGLAGAFALGFALAQAFGWEEGDEEAGDDESAAKPQSADAGAPDSTADSAAAPPQG